MDLNLPLELLPGESDEDLYRLTLDALAEHEPTRHAVPDGLDEMEPGPFRAAILSAIDVSRLNGRDLVVVLRAQHSQMSHHQAGTYEAMAEVAHTVDPDSTRRVETPNEYAIEEIGAALSLTRRKADHELSIALEMRHRLPKIRDALGSGHIDARKASILASHTCHLEVEAARAVIDRVIDAAPDLTTGQLAARLRRLTLEMNPADADARMRYSLSQRRMVAEPNFEGTAALIISECSPDDVYAARDHVDRLARRLKTADEPRTIDQLRADVALALLRGQNGGRKGERGGSVTIQVDLQTLANLADNPGELAGYGPVVAELARKVAREQAGSAWTGVVTDPETGEPLHTVALRRRPTARQVRRIRALHPTCAFPGCRMPALASDIDHIDDHARGGPTTVRNSAPLCRRHHLAKHRGGWKYRKISRIGLEWISPLGHKYRTGRPP